MDRGENTFSPEEAELGELKFKIEINGTERLPLGYDISGDTSEAEEVIETFNDLTGGKYSDGNLYASYISIFAEHKETYPNEEEMQEARKKAEKILERIKTPEFKQKVQKIKGELKELCVNIGLEEVEED